MTHKAANKALNSNQSGSSGSSSISVNSGRKYNQRNGEESSWRSSNHLAGNQANQ